MRIGAHHYFPTRACPIPATLHQRHAFVIEDHASTTKAVQELFEAFERPSNQGYKRSKPKKEAPCVVLALHYSGFINTAEVFSTGRHLVGADDVGRGAPDEMEHLDIMKVRMPAHTHGRHRVHTLTDAYPLLRRPREDTRTASCL